MCKFSRIPDAVLGTTIKDPKMKMLCIQLFALANFGEVQEHGRTLSAGQMMTTLSALMERTGLTKKEVRTRLGKLVAEGKVAKISNNHYLILTIVGYDRYFSTSAGVDNTLKPVCAKGMQTKTVTATVSASHVEPSENRGMGEARNEASVTNSLSVCSMQNDINKDMQNGTPSTLCIEKNNENVVEKGNTTTALSSFENRRKWLVDETNAAIIEKGWQEYSRTLPEFNDAVRKFIAYMGKDTGDGKLRYENYNDFMVSDRLTIWISNEHALKGKIKLH